MNDTLFKIFIIILCVILLAMVLTILIESVRSHQPYRTGKSLTYLRPYQDGYVLADEPDFYLIYRRFRLVPQSIR